MLLLLILLLVICLATLPRWPYSKAWGYYPSGALVLLLILVIILMLCGLMPWGFYW